MKIVIQNNHHLTEPEKHIAAALADTVRKDLKTVGKNTCRKGRCQDRQFTTVRLIIDKNKLSALSIKVDACCQALQKEIESKLYMEELI